MSKLHFIKAPKEVISSYTVKNNLQRVEELAIHNNMKLLSF